MTASQILGNKDYPAICFGGYRALSRDQQPCVEELKEDLKILSAMGYKVLRTYNVHFAHASNLLKAIRALQEADENFEMYVMLGAWIDCENAWTTDPNHNKENTKANSREIETAIALAQEYSEIVKVIAVGNEAMVHWATSYFVMPDVILKWVNYLQKQKKEGKLPPDLWITSSDNFASWGGGDPSYHNKDLEALARAVDYISVHTYPFHDTHYNPAFWNIDDENLNDTNLEAKTKLLMEKARDYAVNQYTNVKNYVESLGINKPIHIGETGWASQSDGFYGASGSKAADEFKQALYYQLMTEWSNAEKVSLFFFEAFDEIWKDAQNPQGSENHFGLFTINGQAKYALWDAVDSGKFASHTRNGHKITKTFEGNKATVFETLLLPKNDSNEKL